MTERSGSTIVVGVDGSPPSVEALRWAVRQAQVTGAALRVVTAWTFPEEPTPFGIVPDVPLPPDQLAQVEARLEAMVGDTGARSSGIAVTTEVMCGHAAAVLVEAARHAELLVVGHRGRRALAEVLLGSVSEHCVRHASCPVVVVRATAR